MLNSKGERELAYVARVTEIVPIEGADRVEVAKIQGWTCMVAKGAFQVGDLGVFFEADSKVPEKEPFLFMEKRHYKVKVQKFFKGTVISDGLLMSFADFGWKDGKYAEGDFLTKELGITYAEAEDNKRKANSTDKYKKMAQRHPKLFQNPIIKKVYKTNFGKKVLFLFFGKKKDKKGSWPAWVVKTDEERIQNLASRIEEFQNEKWIATEKIDGTSTTFTLKGKGRKQEYHVCSRNVAFDTPEKAAKCFYDSNVYLEMDEKYDMHYVLQTIMNETNALYVTIQGETYGGKIQKRDYSRSDHELAVFNVIICGQDGIPRRLNPIEMKAKMDEYGIPTVPIVAIDVELPSTCDEILAMAHGDSLIDGKPREGLVFRNIDGTKSFKAVDNLFILKYHG